MQKNTIKLSCSGQFETVVLQQTCIVLGNMPIALNQNLNTDHPVFCQSEYLLIIRWHPQPDSSQDNII